MMSLRSQRFWPLGLVAAAVAVGVGAAVLAGTRDSTPPEAPTNPPAAVESPVDTGTARATRWAAAQATPISPMPTRTPLPGTTQVVLGAPRALPAGLTLITYTSNGMHGPSYDYRRWIGDGTAVTSEPMISRPLKVAGEPLIGFGDWPTITVSPDGQHMADRMRTGGMCGWDVIADGEDCVVELVRSDDGGRTWRSLGPVPGIWTRPVGFIGDQIILRRSRRVTDSQTTEAFLNERGEPVGPADFAASDVVFSDAREPVWVSRPRPGGNSRGIYRDMAGTVAPPLLALGLLGLTGSDGYVWSLPGGVMISDRDGNVRQQFHIEANGCSLNFLGERAFLEDRGVVSGRFLAGYCSGPAYGAPSSGTPATPTPIATVAAMQSPVFLLDLETGEAFPVLLDASGFDDRTMPLALFPTP